MNLKEAKIMADEIDKKLDIHAFIANKKARIKSVRIIAVQHHDGSYLEFHSAAFQKLDKEWMVVFTEHHGTFLYHFEDVRWIKELDEKILYWHVEED